MTSTRYRVTALLQQLLEAVQPQQTTSGEAHVPLRAVLGSAGDAYACLLPFAAVIYAALGIAELSDFELISVQDVETVALPAMQKRVLLRLAREHNVGRQLGDDN